MIQTLGSISNHILIKRIIEDENIEVYRIWEIWSSNLSYIIVFYLQNYITIYIKLHHGIFKQIFFLVFWSIYLISTLIAFFSLTMASFGILLVVSCCSLYLPKMCLLLLSLTHGLLICSIVKIAFHSSPYICKFS